jgi:hypothetical protein
MDGEERRERRERKGNEELERKRKEKILCLPANDELMSLQR